MANNAKFEIEIYGDTAQFENSLKGVNSAMSSLKGEASQLKRELKLDPTNGDKMQALYKNLQQQVDQTRQKSAKLREELSKIDRSTPKGEQEFIKLSKQLKDSEIQAGYLEKSISEVDGAIKRGNWKVDVDTAPAERKVSLLKKTFGGLKQIGIGALRSIGEMGVSAVTGSIGGWVDDAKATQKAMIALQNTMDFTGQSKDFDSLSKRMQQVAKDTNANTEDALSLGTTFIGLGDKASTAGDKVESIIKANQAFGGTGENLKGVVQAYGQMSAAGKVSAENIGQLTDNNTALGAALKTTVMEMNPTLKKYGSFNAASEKGAISVEMLDKAMSKLGKAGGGGVTTIDDAMASLNETISLALLPALDAITPVVTKMINGIADSIPKVSKWFGDLWDSIAASGAFKSFKATWDSLKSILGSVITIVANVIGSFTGMGGKASESGSAIDKISTIVAGLGKALQIASSKIASFLKWISQSQTRMDVLKGIVVGLAGAFAAFKIGSGIASGVSKFKELQTAIKGGAGAFKALSGIMATNPFVLIAAAIAAVVAGLIYFFTQTKTGQKMWAEFTKFLSDSWQGVMEFFSGLGTWFSEVWNGAVEGGKAIWQGFITFFQGLFTGIGEWFTGIWTGIVEVFTGIWNGIVVVVQTVWATITGVITTAFNVIVTIFQPIVSVFQSIFNLVVAVVQLAWSLILLAARATFQALQAVWNVLVSVFQTIFNAVASVVSTVFNAILNVAKTIWNSLVAVWNVLVSVFQTIFSAVSSVVSTVFSAIGSFAQSAWGVVTGIWNGIVSFFSPLFNSVKGVVSGVFNAFAGFAQTAWSGITSVFNAVVGWFSDKFNGIKDAVSGAFNGFGEIAQNAWNAITGVFDGIVGWFSDLFGGVADVVNGVLGGITGTIDKITGAVKSVTDKVSGLLNNSLVATIDSNLANNGLLANSVSNRQITHANTFNIETTSNATAVDIARAVRRQFDLGKA